MKRLRSIAFLALAFVSGSAFAPDTGAKAVDAALIKTFLANDATAVAACYADDAVLVLPGSAAIKGKKAIFEALAGFLNAITVKDFAITDTNYRISGSLSAAWGHYRMTTVPKAGGEPTIETGTFCEVAMKRGGKWVYVSDHASADPPSPPAK
jgi:uncharacterized protein (TIGR02246 family)